MARLCIVGVAWLTGLVTLDAEIRWIDVSQSTVTAHVTASDAADGDVPGLVLEARLAEGSLDDAEMPHLALVINVDDLRVVDPQRTPAELRRLRAPLVGPTGLDAERFSRVTYHSLTIDHLAPDTWLVRGVLEVHGRFLPLDAHVVRHDDRFTGSTVVVPADFGIAPMRVPGVVGLLGQEVRIDFDIVLEPR